MLESLKILEWLTQTEKDNLSLFCQEKILMPWDVLFEQWDEANAMYILQEWELKVEKTLDGVTKMLWNVSAEEIIWEMALFGEESTRMATAIATQECKLITILSFSIKEITQKHPDLLERIKDIIHIRNMKNQNIA